MSIKQYRGKMHVPGENSKPVHLQLESVSDEADTEVTEDQITDGTLLARVADDETIAGAWTFTTSPAIESGQPILQLNETGVTADNGNWRVEVNSEQFMLRTDNDAKNSPVTAMTIDRTGTTVDSIAFSAPITATSYGGITEANLVDKAAVETVSEEWTFDSNIIVQPDGLADTALLVNGAGSGSTGINLYVNQSQSVGSQTAIKVDQASTSPAIDVASGHVVLAAATTSKPSLRIPHGSAPTSPTDGDIWTTDSGVFAEVDGVTHGLSRVQTLVKTADESVDTSTTLQDDDHFTGIALEADKYYRLEIFGQVNTGSTAGIDFKGKFVFTNTPATTNGVIHAHRYFTQTGDSQDFQVTTDITDEFVLDIASTGADVIAINATFQANATTGGTFKLQWAQNNSNAQALILEEGMSLILTKLN